MGVFDLFRGESAWDPTTAQKQAAMGLTASEGGFVRSHVDGTVELRTIDAGALRRYFIRENGEAVLVESGAPLPGYAWSGRLGAAGMLACFAGTGLGIVGEEAGPDVLISVGIIAFVIGLGTFVAGTAIWGKAFKRAAPPPGEHWIRIGGPDH